MFRAVQDLDTHIDLDAIVIDTASTQLSVDDFDFGF